MGNSPFELLTKQSFFDDFLLLDQATQKKVRKGLGNLQNDPHCPRTKKIFKDRFTNLYRLRIDNHRLVYAVGTNSLAILAVGPRKNIYPRFERGVEGGGRITWQDPKAEPIPVPTHADDPIPDSLPDGEASSPEAVAEESIDTGLGSELFREYLGYLDCPDTAIQLILACKSVDEIIDLDLPSEILNRVLHIAAPPNIEALREQPVFELPDLADLEKLAKGELLSFLLRLDEEQERVARKQIKGPTLVRGGAGTGKSLVALYRIRRLMEPDVQASLFDQKPPKVLFLTFTKALVTASKQLLEKLVGAELLEENVTVTNIDKLALKFFPDRETLNGRPGTPELQRLIRSACTAGANSDSETKRIIRRSPKVFDPAYLLDEFDWVIDGRDVATLNDYLQVDRSGRSVGLDQPARRVVWAIHERWVTNLEEKGATTYVRVLRAAVRETKQAPESRKYDVVVLDEAQDLKPVGIQFTAALAKSPTGLYLTADEKQSIYGRHFSWKSVSEELDFRGRATVLRRNYRNSRAIATAAAQFLNAAGVEGEGPVDAVLDGPQPVCAETEDRRHEATVIANHIRDWAAELKMPTTFAAVLVRHGGREANQLVKWLREEGLKAEFVKSAELDLRRQRVRVMTIHSAKGLEFPMVCIPGLDKGAFPSPDRAAVDEEDDLDLVRHESRLLHVAMTRAMRRLLVTYDAQNPSPFVRMFEPEMWEWM